MIDMPATIVRLLVDLYAQSVAVLYPPVFFFWLVFHSRIQHWRTVGKRAYLYACAGWPLISIPLLLLHRTVFAVRWSMPWWMILAGVLAVIAAVRFATQAAKVISHSTLVGLAELEPHRNPQPVMNTGIYGKTRNPVYLTHSLLIFAAAALSGFAANWVLFAIDLVFVFVVIKTEEKELIARYGREYIDYMRRVPRLVPRWPW
jgi:protein-S-isoprenylcysteine O-methyltransferase Ste14